jgi:MSHA biogenesis protein MshM
VFVLRDIKDALLKMNTGGSKCLLIIDESHLMEDDVLDGIRLLNNLEEGSMKLIQILLLGQDEFMETIKRPEMEPFKQRIATIEMLGKLSGDRIREYISHRIHIAGGRSSIFTDTGWEAVVLAFDSGGAPRVINSLCDGALSTAFERKKTAVDVHDVYEATKTLGIGKKVFHYIVALNTMERKKQEPESPVASTAKADFKREPAPPGVFQQSRTLLQTGTVNFSVNQKKIKMPLLLLLSSVITLVLSILFFCWRSGSPDLMSCLLELIGF